MKRISYIIAALLLLSSCEDFLSFDPLTQKTMRFFRKRQRMPSK